MGDEFQAGICSGNWWNSSRSGLSVGSCSSPCSTALTDMGSFGWASEARSSCEETTASVSDSSMVFPHTQKLPHAPDSVDGGGGGGGGGAVMMDSTLQMMGFGSSSLTMDWNQTLLSRGSGRGSETDFHSMIQDELSSRPIFRRETGMESPTHQVVQKEWIPKSTSFSGGSEDSSSLNAYNKQINQIFPLDQQQQQQHQPSFACNSSSLLPGLFDPPETQLQQHQQSHFETHRPINSPSPNYRINTSEFASPSPLPSQSAPSWPKFPAFLKQHQPTGQLHFSNNAPYWNASAAPMNDARSSFFSSPQTQFLSPTFDEKPSCSSLTTAKSGTEDVRDSGSVVKKAGSSETAYKRPRIETPSPLPTFKVRKEKLGDRITALQQLVSPFGKTDTASVLFEAIEYIKFLHGQVSAFSTPYMKNGAPTQHQQSSDKSKDGEGPKQDLRSRGLCLVPISSTFPVTTETAADFWTPFGGTYR